MTLSCSLFIHTFPVAMLGILMYFSAAHRGAGSGLWNIKAHAWLIQVTAKVNQTVELSQQVKLDTLINLCRVKTWAFQPGKVPCRSLSCEPTTATNSVHWRASSLMLFPPTPLTYLPLNNVSTRHYVPEPGAWMTALCRLMYKEPWIVQSFSET